VDALPYDHPQPIYILLDHFNGKTKDCLEVQIELADHFTAVRRNRFSASRSANPQIPTEQLSSWRSSDRWTQTTRHDQPRLPRGSHRRRLSSFLLSNRFDQSHLRPRSSQELLGLLLGLLALCQATISTPFSKYDVGRRDEWDCSFRQVKAWTV